MPSPQNGAGAVEPVLVVSSPVLEVSSPVLVVSSPEVDEEEVVSSPVEASPIGSSLRMHAVPRVRTRRRRGRRDMRSADRDGPARADPDDPSGVQDLSRRLLAYKGPSSPLARNQAL